MENNHLVEMQLQSDLARCHENLSCDTLFLGTCRGWCHTEYAGVKGSLCRYTQDKLFIFVSATTQKIQANKEFAQKKVLFKKYDSLFSLLNRNILSDFQQFSVLSDVIVSTGQTGLRINVFSFSLKITNYLMSLKTMGAARTPHTWFRVVGISDVSSQWPSSYNLIPWTGGGAVLSFFWGGIFFAVLSQLTFPFEWHQQPISTSSEICCSKKKKKKLVIISLPAFRRAH